MQGAHLDSERKTNLVDLAFGQLSNLALAVEDSLTLPCVRLVAFPALRAFDFGVVPFLPEVKSALALNEFHRGSLANIILLDTF